MVIIIIFMINNHTHLAIRRWRLEYNETEKNHPKQQTMNMGKKNIKIISVKRNRAIPDRRSPGMQSIKTFKPFFFILLLVFLWYHLYYSSILYRPAVHWYELQDFSCCSKKEMCFPFFFFFNMNCLFKGHFSCFYFSIAQYMTVVVVVDIFFHVFDYKAAHTHTKEEKRTRKECWDHHRYIFLSYNFTERNTQKHMCVASVCVNKYNKFFGIIIRYITTQYKYI